MSKKTVWIVGIVLVATIGGLVYWNLSQRSELNELVEQMTIEKEELQEEYEDLAIQFDGYQQMDIRNDSLQDLLSREQQRVQDLLEELRQTKASNARRIAELRPPRPRRSSPSSRRRRSPRPCPTRPKAAPPRWVSPRRRTSISTAGSMCSSTRTTP